VTTLLLLDFPGRRPEAHLTDLGLDRPGVRCRSLLTHPLPTAFDTPSYAAELARRAGPLGAVDGIVAYCAAAPLGVAFAHLTGAPAVFLDPSRCEEWHISAAYATVLGQIAGSGQPTPPLTASLADPARLIADVGADLRRRGREALEREGFSATEAGAVLGHTIDLYLQWFTFLLAVHRREQPSLLGPALQVLSRKHPELTPELGIERADTVRIDCERSELARHHRTRDAVLRFFGVTTAIPAQRG
jgi:hypothetical protein